MKRVLLIPSDHGGGKGHVARCIYLAKRMQAAGLEPALVLENKHYQDGINAGIPTYLFNTRRERLLKWQFKSPHWPKVEMVNIREKPPVFLAFDGLAYQVPRDGYLSQKLVRRRFRLLKKIVDGFKPDVLVGDTHFLTFLLGKNFNMPVIQISRLAGFPPKPEFFWWLEEPPDLTKPNALAPFESLLETLGVSDIHKAEDLLQGDLYLIPASPAIEPVEFKSKKLVFTGPMAEISRGTQKISFFNEQNDIPKIYVTIGGGSNRFSEHQFFEAILNMFDRTDFKVLVSTGRSLPAKNYQGRSVNVVFTNWVNGVSAINQSDLVIQHGGYSSTMEVLLSGKPSIVIPFHSEQEGNGRRLQKLGIGDLLLPYSGALQKLKFSWPFGTYTMLGGMEMKLGRETLFPLTDLIYDQELYGRLKKVQSDLQELQNEFDPLKLLKML